MNLFGYLLEIRGIMMYGQFEVKDERIRKMIEDHRQTIYRIKGDIRDDEDYEGYFKMNGQLNGLRVELDSVSCRDSFYEYYVQ